MPGGPQGAGARCGREIPLACRARDWTYDVAAISASSASAGGHP